MRNRCFAIIFVVVVFAFGASVQAGVVTVTPDNMASLGWSIETNSGGRTPGTAYGAFTKWGPCVYGRRGFLAEDSQNLGQGAFYAECGFGGQLTTDKTPDTVWLGVDQFNGQSLAGVKLSQIKTMTYYSYVDEAPTRIESNASWESIKMSWHGCNSPIMLQITAASPDGSDYKQFWLRPRSWGTGVQGPDGGMDGSIEGCWQKLNGITDRWYHAPERSDSTDDYDYANWAAVCAAWPDYKIVTTATAYPLKSAGWKGASTPPGLIYSTATGKGLNFEVGARFFKAPLYHNGTAARNWYPESIGFRGHVDYFTLGIDQNGDGDDYDTGEQSTYNFEPSASEPEPTIVYANARMLKQLEAMLGKTFTRSRFMTKIFGQVMERSGNPIWAAFEDGSNLMQMFHNDPPEPYYESIRACQYLDYERGEGLPAGMYIGSYWSCWGYVERLRGYNGPGTPPLMVWTDRSHYRQLYE